MDWSKVMGEEARGDEDWLAMGAFGLCGLILVWGVIAQKWRFLTSESESNAMIAGSFSFSESCDVVTISSMRLRSSIEAYTRARLSCSLWRFSRSRMRLSGLLGCNGIICLYGQIGIE